MATAIDVMMFVEDLEQFPVTIDAFGRAEKERRTGVEGVVEGSQNPVLQITAQVDHQVAAGD